MHVFFDVLKGIGAILAGAAIVAILMVVIELIAGKDDK